LQYDYLIIGGGMTAAAALRGIRQVDPTGAIGLISAETSPPYQRPPLTKKLWQGEPLESIWIPIPDDGVTLHLGRTAQSLDPAAHQVRDDQGRTYSYGTLLLATGGTPRRLPFGGDRIIYFRTLDDYHRLRAATGRGDRTVVIGGGFIGSEIAAALAMNDQPVTLITPGAGVGDRTLPPDLVQFLNAHYRQKGVELLTGERATGLVEDGDQLTITTGSGREIRAGSVVAGIGIQPNTALAEAAGLTVDDGIRVDEFLRTSDPHIYAAGDVARFYDPALQTRRRVEHENNANTMGRRAGRAMAGQPAPYQHLPSFYSDLFEFGYEAVGEVDARLELFADWREPYREGVIYYLHEGRVRGVLLWNVWGQVKAARRVIAEPGPVRPADLQGRLPEL
jgi:NADPH-dependent 2,4-dienoyl-CoA reductase/sulfur reductase-like enzyme